MKVNIWQDELCPVFDIDEANGGVDIPDELIAKYRACLSALRAMQGEIQPYYDEQERLYVAGVR
jgi:hypothetical protein